MTTLFGKKIDGKFLEGLLVVCAVFWIFVNFYLAFISFWPVDWAPLKTVDLQKLEILNTGKIYPGTTIHYKLTGVKYINAPGEVSRWIIDDRIFQFSGFQSNLPTGPFTKQSSIFLPITAVPGEDGTGAPHILKWTVCYEEVVPFKKICKSIESKPFMVYKKD